MDLSTDRRIPAALSNDENKILEENVDDKLKELSAVQLDIDENTDRCQMLEDHQKVLKEELEALHVFDMAIVCRAIGASSSLLEITSSTTDRGNDRTVSYQRGRR